MAGQFTNTIALIRNCFFSFKTEDNKFALLYANPVILLAENQLELLRLLKKKK